MILYSAHYMHHLNLLICEIKMFYLRDKQEAQQIQIKNFMPRSNLQEVRDKICKHE